MENETQRLTHEFDRETLIQLLEVDPSVLRLIEDQDDELCDIAVSKNGFCIQYVKNKTPTLILKAIKNYGPSIRYIDNPTDEMIHTAIEYDPESILQLKHITPELFYKALCVSRTHWRSTDLFNYNECKMKTNYDKLRLMELILTDENLPNHYIYRI